MNLEFETDAATEEDEDHDEALGEESDSSVSLIMDSSEEYDLSDQEIDESEDDDYYDTDSDFDGDYDESGGDSGF
ncbi:MAG: hypothetical protein AB7I41_22765 [Candidatus Sericytochromatia bacterium]